MHPPHGCRILGLMALWIGIGFHSAMAQNPSAKMAIIGRGARTENLFTIVGAVSRSGVYRGPARELSLAELVQAAGGIDESARGVLKVIRDGRPRFYVTYDPATAADSLLVSGDVVVVPQTPVFDKESSLDAAPPVVEPPRKLVPVVCLGLIERPVVLPLDPTIDTCEKLIDRLLQPRELVESTRIIAPDQGNETTLSVGTVLIFDSDLVNTAPLRNPQALPPIIDLAATKSVRAVGPQTTQSSENVPPGWAVAEPFHSHKERSLPNAEPARIAEDPTASPTAAPVFADEFPMMNAAPLELPQLPAQPQSLASATADSLAPTITQQPTATQTTPSRLEVEPTVPTQPGTDVNLNDIRRLMPPASPEPTTQTAPAQLALAERPVLTSDFTDSDLVTSSIATAQEASGPNQSVRWIAGGTLALFLLVCAGWGVWSTVRDSKPFLAEQSSIEAATEAPPAQSPATEDHVEMLIRRKLAVVEQPVEISQTWPLHGTAVGHRRLILNAAHPTPNAPHFNKARRSAPRDAVSVSQRSQQDRQLRTALRESLRGVPIEEEPWSPVPHTGSNGPDPGIPNSPLGHSEAADTQRSPATGSAPVTPPVLAPTPNPPSRPAELQPQVTSSAPMGHTAPQNQTASNFDIVQPQTPSETSSLGALERALHHITREKQG